MIKTYDLLKKVLTDIEENIRDGINVDTVVKNHSISERHLQRLFKLAFNQSLGFYIRSQKLAASIDDLLNTNLNVLDIALDYGFEYEHTYIRAFKRKFGITPGNLRKTRQVSREFHTR
jgi:AraC family transcriptional regulator